MTKMLYMAYETPAMGAMYSRYTNGTSSLARASPVGRFLPGIHDGPQAFSVQDWQRQCGLMAQIPPPPRQPPHQQLPPLLRPQPAQKPVSPLPHDMAWVVCVSGTAPNLYASEGGRRRDLGHEVKSVRGWGDCSGGWAGRGEGRGHGQREERRSASVEEGHVACSIDRSVRRVRCMGGCWTYCCAMGGLRRVAGRATARRQPRAFMVSRLPRA